MAKHDERKYENEIFRRLSESLELKEEESLLGGQFGKPVWRMIQKADKGLPTTLKCIKDRCLETARSEKNNIICLDLLCDILYKAKRSRKTEYFTCRHGMSGFCYPIVQGKKVYGYILMCNAHGEISQVLVKMFARFLDVLVKEIQKELELSKLYEAIRPRAIALSTVHTIHRLLTSTLNLDELLPRIARLSLQIVRANRCSIKLADKARKMLLPKATVDLRKKNVKMKKVKVGMYAPGKAFKRMKTIMGKDYMAVPMIDQDVIGVITLYDKVDDTQFNQFDQEIMSTLAEQAVIAINNALLYKEQERMTESTIKSLAALLDTHAPGKLTPRAPYIKIILDVGRRLRLSEEELKSLEYAYLLHDVGKAVLPPSLLSKPKKLTGREYKLIKEHPMRGVKILKPLKALKASAPMILHQRERFDGKGYPDRLKAKKIPLGARIIAVVSAFEAMTAKRPYQTQKKIDKAIKEIKRNSGTQFDPKIVDIFLKVLSRRNVIKMLRRERNGT